MAIKQCKRCNAIFDSFGKDLCSKCVEEMDMAFTKARDYIYDHPLANVPEISHKTGVEEKDILGMIREGRISTGTPEGSGLKCRQCGRPVASGSMCDDCKQSLGTQFGQMRDRMGGAGGAQQIEPAWMRDKNENKTKKRSSGMHIDIKRDR